MFNKTSSLSISGQSYYNIKELLDSLHTGFISNIENNDIVSINNSINTINAKFPVIDANQA